MLIIEPSSCQYLSGFFALTVSAIIKRDFIVTRCQNMLTTSVSGVRSVRTVSFKYLAIPRAFFLNDTT